MRLDDIHSRPDQTPGQQEEAVIIIIAHRRDGIQQGELKVWGFNGGACECE